jgi:hypothetical protein
MTMLLSKKFEWCVVESSSSKEKERERKKIGGQGFGGKRFDTSSKRETHPQPQ